MSGMIVGGWEYVWAVYGLTWLALAGYGVGLVIRWRSA